MKPKPDCPVCGVFQTSVYVDLERATLNDLVEQFLRADLGYGDKDLVVNNDVGILYDADETENLSKKLSDLGGLHVGTHVYQVANVQQVSHRIHSSPLSTMTTRTHLLTSS